jgi:hypothetical protein
MDKVDVDQAIRDLELNFCKMLGEQARGELLC